MSVWELFAKIRGLVNFGTYKKRDGKKITVQTDFGRTVEGEECFPYGFFSKAQEGRVIVLSQGGNAASFLLLPVCSSDGAPNLQEGDSCVWAQDGAFVITRKDGTLELNGTDYGGLIKINALKQELEKTNTFLKTFLQVLSVPVPEAGNGAPSSFQSTLNGALSALPLADFSQIENDKVQHGGS